MGISEDIAPKHIPRKNSMDFGAHEKDRQRRHSRNLADLSAKNFVIPENEDQPVKLTFPNPMSKETEESETSTGEIAITSDHEPVQDKIAAKEEFTNSFFGDIKNTDPAKIKKITPKPSSSERENYGKILEKYINIWTLWLVLFALLGVLVYQNFDLVKKYFIKTELKIVDSDKNADSAEPKVPIYESESPTAEATEQTQTSTAATTDTQSNASATTETTPASTPSTLQGQSTISILNGNGVRNDGNKLKTVLVESGYTISNTGNAKSFSYQATIIYYKTGKDALATALKNVMSSYSVTTKNDDSIASKYDIVIVIGKK